MTAMMGKDEENRRRLGAFLRAQRERLPPEATGLPVTRRRRTPGLRREELASLAGMSATWYTRIEQGRDVSMSPGAAGRLANALKLGVVARRHLFELAGLAEATRPGGGTDALPPGLAASVMVIAAPAYVLDAHWTARAWNGPAAALFAEWLAGPDHNLLRYVFLNPSAHRFVVNWEARARRLLAEFRADTAGRANDSDVAGLIQGLRAGSNCFGRWWDEQQVMGREGGERAFNLADGSMLRLHQLTLTPDSDPGCKLVILLDAAVSPEPVLMPVIFGDASEVMG
jgi:transcriptional regulator with XRE-family HTH domain